MCFIRLSTRYMHAIILYIQFILDMLTRSPRVIDKDIELKL